MSTANPFKQKGVVLADGAMGSELIKRGFDAGSGLCRLNLEHPEVIQEIHRGYVQAGAQILLTHTFEANELSLSRYGLESQAREFNRAAVTHARVASQGAWVFGSVGPVTDKNRHQVKKAYSEQVQALTTAGIDGLVLETFCDFQTLEWAYESCAELNLSCPLVVSLSPHGDFADQADLQRAVARVSQWSLSALGLNCFDQIDQARCFLEFCESCHVPSVWLKMNAGRPQGQQKNWVYPIDSQAFCQQIQSVLTPQVKVIGGCCGTTAEYIKGLSLAVS